MTFLTFPIRNETTSHPIRVIFRHIGKTRKPPCRERVAFFLLFPSIYSFAEEACAHIIYIYIPTAITMAAISDFILSVLWGLQPYSPLFCVNFTAAPPKKQPVAVVVIYILRTFALKLSIVTLVCAMFADTIGIFNVCETAACHDLHRAPDTPDTLVDGITFYATSSNSFGIYLCLTSHPLVSVFLPSAEKNRHL